MKKITSLKSLDSFLFDVLTKFFFNFAKIPVLRRQRHFSWNWTEL